MMEAVTAQKRECSEAEITGGRVKGRSPQGSRRMGGRGRKSSENLRRTASSPAGRFSKHLHLCLKLEGEIHPRHENVKALSLEVVIKILSG